MGIFDHIFSKAHAGREMPPAAPQPMPAAVMPPGQAPQTIKDFPQDFSKYTYEGPSLMTFKGRDGAGNQVTRCSLGARMVSKSGTLDGASAELETTCTARDLACSGHPQAQAIIGKLNDYHAHNIQGARDPSMMAEPAAATSADTQATTQGHASARFSQNSFKV
jgi:hypothetical protein